MPMQVVPDGRYPSWMSRITRHPSMGHSTALSRHDSHSQTSSQNRWIIQVGVHVGCLSNHRLHQSSVKRLLENIHFRMMVRSFYRPLQVLAHLLAIGHWHRDMLLAYRRIYSS